MSIGERIKEWMESNNLSIAKINKETGIGKSTMSDYVKDKSIIGGANLITLYEIYDIDINYILTGEIKRNSERYPEICDILDTLTEEERFTMKYMIKKEYKEIIDQRVTSSVSKDTG
jgi:transcriptional regulator with XRE-family HTH domain